MCNVCKDEQCHYGEYCYPGGKSIRLAEKLKMLRSHQRTIDLVAGITSDSEARERWEKMAAENEAKIAALEAQLK